ncbi:MAG: hypothetical protein ACI8YQ_002518 [Polaribacter sp.]|jgi:hypothetical protein
MNLKEAKIMLEKINRLYDSMIIDSKIDPFEQELMLSYIKKMYAAFSANGEAMNPVVESRPAPKVVKRIVVDPPKVVAPSPVSDPEELEMIEVAEVVPPAPAPKPQPKPSPKPKPKPAPTPPPVVKVTTVNDDIAELFADDEGKELSDRLASLPINDLTKAMGLNERILTVNELFGKDQQAFTTSMNIMNTMGNFEEAKVHLAECAQKYGWIDGKKVKKVKVFIKLVKRRYK